MSVYAMPVIMTVFLFAPFMLGIYMKKSNKLTDDMTCKLIIFTGLILRLTYIAYTNVETRQHDVHGFFRYNAGHAQYICYLFENHSLPDFDPREIFQFYHPPLHHIICALWLTITDKLGLDATTTGVDTLQYLTVAYSTLFCVFASKTFKLLGIKPKAASLCTAIVTFHPTLIIMSGSLNNDMLSSLFTMTALYYTVKWAKDKTFSSIIAIALSIGLGMFTKLSVGLIAPAVASVFLYVFVINIKEWKRLVTQFLTFGVICVPIGLYWSVRNYVRFGVPLNYVPLLSRESDQYIDKSPIERIFNWLPYQFSSPFTQWEWNGAAYNEFNPIIALWKNAMFDEETFFRRSITLQSFCTALFLAGIAMSLIAVVGLIVMWLKGREIEIENKLLLSAVALVVFCNYMTFCINYPHVCTENMRYCVPLIFVGAAFTGILIQRADESKNVNYNKFSAVIKKCAIVFCGLSAFVYTAMFFYEAENTGF